MGVLNTVYAGDECAGYYKVTFIVKDGDGTKLTRGFDSPYLAKKFINKLKHSKRCLLVSYPNL